MNNFQEFNNFDDNDEIAIIGINGRFPGANNVDKFWENLRDGVESISHFTDEELLTAGIEPTLLNDPNYVKAGSIMEGIELFDAAFFGFTPREAEITDPQHRIFLESAWEALESAGYDSEFYNGKIGVYAGVTNSNYLFTNLYSNQDLMQSVDALNIFIGNEKDNLSTQTSYKLNLTGPSINVQNNCSTSLIAVHLACQSLLNGESDIALAGGVSIAKLPQKSGYQYQEGVLCSPDGHCRTFDAKAKGTVFGDGLGIVVLKRLVDAVADGDFIHAVIKGSAINNDGSLKVGYTAPSVNGQREVILEALALAGVEPDTISYIEAHGTATPLGDPIEIKALTQAFRASTNRKNFCAIGSAKTNIGHLDTAAGVTGLIKTVQALKHQQIPPSLNFEKPNPEIDFANSPFYVNTKLSEWKTNGLPRRAGVSSFGVGGTNAHVILEEAPVIETSSASRPWQLLLLSAKTSTALESATANLAAYLQQDPDINLPDVAYTLQVGRRAFDHRRLVVCQDRNDAVKLLKFEDPQRVFSYHYKPSRCPVIFMFSGQGSQYVNMGRELYEVEPTYRRYVDTCAEILQPHLGLDIRHLLFASEEITAANQLQPTLFVIEYALAELLMSWGVCPEAMIGDGIGEYVAAAIAGVFTLEDALRIVANRGLRSLKKVQLNPPRISFISNETGSWITDAQATNPNYWNQNLQHVKFSDSISHLLEQFEGVFLEVGPGQNLSTLTKQHLDINAKQHVLTSLPHAQEQQSDVSFLLETLGQLWLFGVDIDWSEFYTHEQRHRLPLPTYPFERQRYWIDAKQGKNDSHTPALLSKKPDIADWFYIPFWKPSLPPVQLDSQYLKTDKSCLIFIDECGLGINLVKQLEKLNQDVVTVKIGDKFTTLDNEYTINPQNHQDYDTLFQELFRQNKLPKMIVHLWNVTPICNQVEIEKVTQAQETGFYSLLFIAQALGKQETTDIQITVISNNLQPVTGTEALCPEKATLLGPIKVIPQEYANINCRSIDVIFPANGSWQEEKLVEKLLTELTLNEPEKLIAYRGLNRWVQSFEPVRFDKVKIEKPRLKEKGVYFITGGLGGIGLVLAEYLARTVQAKLLLVGRSALPKKDEWEKWLATHDETDSISCKIRKVQKLEDLGAEVLAIAADVSNTEQMQSAIAQAQEQFGQLNGVIHAAGVPGGGVIQRKTQQEAESILAPKVKGTLVIDAIVKDIQLDFFILVSSNSSIVAEFGQVDYCAANAFLDAFAHNATNGITTSINWDTWQEVGMAVNTELPQRLQELRKENLQQGILTNEGVDVFLRILGNTMPQVVISTSDLLDILKQYNSDKKIQSLEFLETVNTSKLKYPRPELSNDYIAARSKIEQKLVDIWQEVIGIERIGIYDNFFELGGDSLIGIQLITIVNKAFNSNLAIAKLYECPNISSMAKIFTPKDSQEKTFEQRLNRGQRRRQMKMQTN
ncbi:SDR family NAD(P)-dependent oxidoreductase [Komarekiella sp. 'clone 1']|uniref:Phenolphthiocerol/phthiocerol polyketide synthase subunit E n=1 Tax=Komarekiella delphini-convector SJRDD-AB1 TaxID=2593771 RepID=A0AA40T099_9NOST|nr:type I polyketide synthase [Komarekiella delphini-convector]MBD6618574.1 SDR family NAD(P)-dependent oxidoreductase [Komarekiella delphini-convector SJRDD-AB1]